MSNGVDKIPELLHAIELVNDAIALTEKALVDNPSIDEERELNIKLARLKARLAVLDAELDAVPGMIGRQDRQAQARSQSQARAVTEGKAGSLGARAQHPRVVRRLGRQT